MNGSGGLKPPMQDMAPGGSHSIRAKIRHGSLCSVVDLWLAVNIGFSKKGRSSRMI